MPQPSSCTCADALKPAQAFRGATSLARLVFHVNNIPVRRWLALPYQVGAKRRGGRSFSIATEDQLTLDGWFSPAHRDVPRRPPVILMHGWSEMKEFYFRHAYRFNAAGHDTIHFDHRGHGRSSRAMTTFGLREKTDLAHVIATAQRLGLIDKRPILMGHSMGAATALMGAGDKLPIVGVIASAPFKDLASAVDSFRQVLTPWLSASGLQGGFDRVAQQAGFAINDVSPINAMRQIDVPILFVEAGRDWVLPPDRHVKPLREALPKDQTQTFRVEGASHFNLRRRNWPGLNERLLAFCATCPDVPL